MGVGGAWGHKGCVDPGSTEMGTELEHRQGTSQNPTSDSETPSCTRCELTVNREDK
jgi:hypothetical protein